MSPRSGDLQRDLLTEGAEDRVGETIADSQLPLRSHNETKGREEEEVRNEDIVNRHTSPFHQA